MRSSSLEVNKISQIWFLTNFFFVYELLLQTTRSDFVVFAALFKKQFYESILKSIYHSFFSLIKNSCT